MKPYSGDWKNAEDYPPIGCTNSELLAWEFIRRNVEYAKEVEVMAKFLETEEYSKGFKLNSKSILDGVVCYPEARPGETAEQFYKRNSIKRIKRRRIVKPANTFTSKWGLKKPVPPETKFESGLVKFEKSHVRLKRTQEFKTENFRLTLHPNEIAARFRLDLPISKQLKQVKHMLVLEASEYDQRHKMLSDEEKTTYVANANNEHTKSVFANANYWLRCFDASNRPIKGTNNPVARRELEDGNSLRLKVFNAEIELLNAEKSEKKIKLKKLSLAKVKGFQGLAHDYIYGKKFQKLLYGESNPLQAETDIQKNELDNWIRSINSDNESPSL
jgi:hypothetical protein